MSGKTRAEKRQRQLEGAPDADRIRQARLEAGLTQRELSAVTGLSVFSITRYENGRTVPRGPSLRAIAQETNRPIAWFFGQDGVAA